MTSMGASTPVHPLQGKNEAEELRPGRLREVGDFELLEKLGQGAMGTVFKVRQKSMERIVALKILPPSIARNKTFIARFQREARTVVFAKTLN